MSTTTNFTADSELSASRPTYPQHWSAYNAAQVWEKQNVAQMLSELCESIHAPVQRRGRPRIPIGDGIFCAVMKVYGGFSGRRSMTDLRDYAESGLIDRAPHYNSVFTFLEDLTITPILNRLVEVSAVPLRAVETDFAVDSTGFSTRSYVRWFDAKYGKPKKCPWVKAHVMIGVKTKVITSIAVTGGTEADIKQFAPLVESTAERFTMKEVSADKAYLGRSNLHLAFDMGIDPLIPFKANSCYNYHDPIWNGYFERFQKQPKEFYELYHKRSNVESAFSMIKRKFGSFVRSKSPIAQVNEVLCKALCHNLCVVLEASYEGVLPECGAA